MIHNRIIINKSAAARVLNVAVKLVQEVREFANVVWVWIKGQRPRFVSKAAFVRQFHTFRRLGSTGCFVLAVSRTDHGSFWSVQGSSGIHTVNTSYDTHEIRCSCDDFQHHGSFCKHIHAVIDATIEQANAIVNDG